MVLLLSTQRYCQHVLNETLRTAKLTPIAARLQEVEGKVDQHLIPKEVSDSGLLLLWSREDVTVPPGSGSGLASARSLRV